jgi:hypothetical protein
MHVSCSRRRGPWLAGQCTIPQEASSLRRTFPLALNGINANSAASKCGQFKQRGKHATAPHVKGFRRLNINLQTIVTI